MARFRLSRPATADLAHVLAASEAMGGVAARLRYAALIAAGLRKAAAQPLGPASRAREALGVGLRSLHLRHARSGTGVAQPVHVLFFRPAGRDLIEIVRVLHERMDPERHLDRTP